MKILVIGSGAREHALIWKLSLGCDVELIYSNSNNPGILDENKVKRINLETIDEMVNFAKNEGITYTIVGPENPLMEGIGDKFRSENLLIFAPNKDEAMLEGDKDFAKDFMKKYGVSCSKSNTFTDLNLAINYIKGRSYPIVLKASGLCQGKGVVIAQDEKEAISTLEDFMINKVFGESGNKVVIEDYMVGKEISILSIYDGNNIYPMLSSMDHKKIGEGETGLNTGGMGTIAPSPYFTEDVKKDFLENILMPTLKGLKQEGLNTPSCIFFGLMLTKDGIKCMEYNMRFGDPETQSVLYLLKSDLSKILYEASKGTLEGNTMEFYDETALTVVVSSKGYPKAYVKNIELTLPRNKDIKLFFAGVKKEADLLLSNGGRIFNVTTKCKDKDEARKILYTYLEEINVLNKDIYFRRDIGNV